MHIINGGGIILKGKEGLSLLNCTGKIYTTVMDTQSPNHLSSQYENTA